jgi:hypothetical protein
MIVSPTIFETITWLNVYNHNKVDESKHCYDMNKQYCFFLIVVVASI